ncbi:hypothetical protein Mgra_00010111 [Meloidogyne graminicola]|uniref:Uncharacterized protein n=1 Tax=Meloidogyne graminicola TaxID=189291 RepID=A0A8S9ZAX1_9BILA|nr:hypothetical protein Mgra_00010111 [Meloidogyne graminicola]
MSNRNVWEFIVKKNCDEGIGGLCWEDDDCCQGKCRNNKCCYLNKRGHCISVYHLNKILF